MWAKQNLGCHCGGRVAVWGRCITDQTVVPPSIVLGSQGPWIQEDSFVRRWEVGHAQIPKIDDLELETDQPNHMSPNDHSGSNSWCWSWGHVYWPATPPTCWVTFNYSLPFSVPSSPHLYSDGIEPFLGVLLVPTDCPSYVISDCCPQHSLCAMPRNFQSWGFHCQEWVSPIPLTHSLTMACWTTVPGTELGMGIRKWYDSRVPVCMGSHSTESRKDGEGHLHFCSQPDGQLDLLPVLL